MLILIKLKDHHVFVKFIIIFIKLYHKFDFKLGLFVGAHQIDHSNNCHPLLNFG
jgi:hypothetical protein